MVVTKNVERRWFRRYRSFFIFGILIFGFQLYLALKFLTIHGETTENNKWNPHKVMSDLSDVDNSVNSARRLREGFVVDDEDSFSNTNIENTQRLRNKQDYNTLNSQKSKANQSFLRLEEFDFVPGCEIHTKEAVSAIHRAKTQKCKQELVNVTCLMQQGLLYPKVLPNYCPNSGLAAKKSLGCFKDEKNYRILSGYYANLKNSNSPEHCIQLCLQSGYPYSGVQYSTECFCGNDEPPSTARLPDSSCNMKCPTNPHLACGGYFTIDVFQTGITKFSPQIAQTSAPKETKPVRIVFLLTLNGRAVRQVRRLIKILFHKNNYFYIHIDSRQDYMFRELLSLERQFPNIQIARRRFSTIWGGASLLRMLLTSMQELLASKWHWDFVINLSESDFPVKTINQLVEFLSANKDKNFVKSHGREVQRFIQKQGLDKTFVECDAHMWRQGDRKLPWGVQIDGGSDWVALSRPFVSYVASTKPDKLVEGLISVFQYTLLPAESFFHTVLRNSKFCNTYVDNNLHVTNWKRKLGCKCQYKHVVDWCGCSPNDFKPDDWLRIQGTESKQLFFARKFEPIINQAIILQVEEWLYGPAPLNIINMNSYWQSFYHNADLSPAVDDALLTISSSVARVVAKTSQNHCKIEPGNVLELTSYHFNDNYEGTLILYEAHIVGIGNVMFETFIKPRDHLFLTKSSSLIQRLQALAVSSEYDQKEQTLRNFARILGPFSDPILVYQFLPSLANNAKMFNITFLWIDPAGQLIEISEVAIDETYVIAHIKPGLKEPLLPGVWTVKLVYKKQIAAHCNFLVTPLEFISNALLSQTQASFIHRGSSTVKEFDQSWNAFLGSETERDALVRKSLANAKRFDLDLREWIDGLTNKFYKVKQNCILPAKNVTNVFCGTVKFEFCNATDWSSRSPDPKSFIGKVNDTTGYLEKLW